MPAAAAPQEPAKKSNKGCVTALVVVLVIALVGAGAVIGGILFVGNEVSNRVESLGGADGGASEIVGLVGGECVEFQMAFTTLAFTGMFTAGADESQRAEMEAALGDLRSMVPDEVSDDFDVIAGAYEEAMAIAFQPEALAGGGPSQEESQRAEEILESPEVVEAQERINAWLEENCA